MQCSSAAGPAPPPLTHAMLDPRPVPQRGSFVFDVHWSSCQQRNFLDDRHRRNAQESLGGCRRRPRGGSGRPPPQLGRRVNHGRRRPALSGVPERRLRRRLRHSAIGTRGITPGCTACTMPSAALRLPSYPAVYKRLYAASRLGRCDPEVN
jgi:hypothetical protein